MGSLSGEPAVLKTLLVKLNLGLNTSLVETLLIVCPATKLASLISPLGEGLFHFHCINN